MNTASILNWAIQTGLAVSLLIIVILIIRRPFTRYFGAQAAYALWALPLIRLFVPTITVPQFRQAIPDIIPDMSAMIVQSYASQQSAAGPVMDKHIDVGVIILGIWIAVSIMWLTYQLMRQRQFVQRIQEKSDGASPAIRIIARRAAQDLNLKRLPELRCASNNSGPLVTGIARPLILLPQGFETQFTPAQQYFALTHELAHIKRRDLWTAAMALLFRAVNWPNPLVHYAAHKFRADQEAACDAAVLKAAGGGAHNTHDYAETLLQAAKSAASPKKYVPLGLTIHYPLKERLMTIATPKTKTGFLPRAAVLTSLAAVLAVSAPMTMAAGHPDADNTVTVKDKSKQVIKWIEDNDGDRTEKHYEIIKEDGETKAYKIDEDGKKTEVDIADIEAENDFELMTWKDGQAMVMGEGKNMVIKRLHKHMDDMSFDDDKKREFVIKRLTKGQNKNTFAFSTDDDVKFHFDKKGFAFGDGSQAQVLLETAQSLLDQAENDEHSLKTQQKLEKARKALEEAREAVEKENK